MSRRRSTIVCLGLTAALATSLAGCGAEDDGDPEYTGICVDKATGVRLEDSVCDTDPLPDEADFTAVEAAATPGAGATTGSATTSATTNGATSSTTSATSSGTSAPRSGSTSGTLAPDGVPTTSASVDCVPATGAGATGPTVTATLPSAASPTTSTSASTIWEGSCPPGQTPAGSASGTPSPATTTVYRNSGSHGWFFIPWGWAAPPIGGYAGRGSYYPPTNTRYSRGGMTRTGGTVGKSTVSGGKVSTSRGGFGGSGGKAGS